MTTHLSVNHYGCTYYCINEDPYIYETPIYMGSLIMKDNEKKDLLSSLFVFSFSLFISSFFITRYQHECSNKQSHKTSKVF